MNRALLLLIRLQTRGFFRRMLRGSMSPKRAIFLMLGIGVLALWLGPPLLTSIAVQHGRAGELRASSRRFETVAPIALLGICIITMISSAGDKAIAFTQGEVDMLFPGPFSRRQLLGYKLLKSALAALLTALLLSVALMPYARSWPACYVGVLLTLLFIQLFSTAGVLLGQALSRHAHTLTRRLILVLAVVVVVLVAREWIMEGGGLSGLAAFRASESGRRLLAPFEPFGRAITARRPSTFAQAAAEGALIDLGLLLTVVMLDANYMEAALAASRRRYAQIRRIRSGSLLSPNITGNVRSWLPGPRWAAGVGPIAWRQATSALRSAKGLLLLLLIIGVAIGPLFATALQTSDVAQPLVGALAWLTILLSGMLKFDFRGDLDHIEELKSLPLRPSAIAVGQVLVPTLVLTAAHILLLSSVALAVDAQRDVLLIAACLALPFNALLMTTENLIFLMFPTRPAAASPGDFQVLGRQAAQLVMKAICVCIGATVAIGPGIYLYILTGGSKIVLVGFAGAMLAGEAAALIPAIAWAYNRFDPSVDTPA